MSLRLKGLPWLALALVPSVLLAEGPDLEAVHFGLQASLATPRQDLRDLTTKTGTEGGFFFEQDLDATWSARARFDYTSFSQGAARITPYNAGFVPATATQVAVNQVSLGGEARMHPRGLAGVFFLGGAFGSRLEFRSIGPDPSGTLPALETKEKTSFKLGLSLGVGYTILPACSATLRCTALGVAGATFATTELGIEYRF